MKRPVTLVLEDTPLENALAKIEAQTGIQFVVELPFMRNCPVTLVVRDQSAPPGQRVVSRRDHDQVEFVTRLEDEPVIGQIGGPP